MRLIYMIRAAQMVGTLWALGLLFSVSSFCERTRYPVKSCPAFRGYPLLHPQDTATSEHMKSMRAADARGGKSLKQMIPSTPTETTMVDGDASTIVPEASTPETSSNSAPPSSSPDVPTTVPEAAKLRKRRDDQAVQLPGNGVEGGDRVKKVKVAAASPIATTITAEKVAEKEHTVTPASTPSDEKKAAGAEEDKKSVDHKLAETSTESTATAEPAKHPDAGEKVEIPSAASITGAAKTPKDAGKDQQTTVASGTLGGNLPPALPADQRTHVLEHSNAHLQTIRCIELTSDAYFGRSRSPFAQHLKGLFICGPLLVVIAIYLVCSVLRTRLGSKTPGEFTGMLGSLFHMSMWMIVNLSMYFIANHWARNWQVVSNETFMPAFPNEWNSLMLLASLMMLAGSLETWFHRHLYYDVLMERSYRCYEVVDDSEANADNDGGHYSRTNVY